ncbi:MAG: nucleoside deaminase [Saprospiraceae bacterium]|nr:nucleoside deaminase [Saprospiraceae bacterium]
MSDTYFMDQAIKEAHKALQEDEVPVGAIVVCDQKIIARAYNQTEKLQDATAHAELLAITAAAAHLGSKFLWECTMFVTLEPCIMCAGALYWSRMGRLVYGASDDKKGFMNHGKVLLHPSTKLEYGVCHDACADLLSGFFAAKRM